MKLEAIKKRIASLNQDVKSNSGEKIDYSKIYWKPKSAGDYTIRFVPSIVKSETEPFLEHFVIYDIDRFPVSSLINWNEKCPVNEFAKTLINSGDTEKWKLGKKLEPKLRAFAPIIVRGEEDKGVRQLEISKTLYMELLTYADDPDYGDFSDIKEGFDWVVTATPAASGKGFSLSVKPKRKNSPLSRDVNKIKEWLKIQPSVLDTKAIYKKSYEQLKDILLKYLTPEEEDDVSSEPVNEDVLQSPTTSSPIKSTFQLTKNDEFDEMFDEKEPSLDSNDEDDLPF